MHAGRCIADSVRPAVAERVDDGVERKELVVSDGLKQDSGGAIDRADTLKIDVDYCSCLNVVNRLSSQVTTDKGREERQLQGNGLHVPASDNPGEPYDHPCWVESTYTEGSFDGAATCRGAGRILVEHILGELSRRIWAGSVGQISGQRQHSLVVEAS